MCMGGSAPSAPPPPAPPPAAPMAAATTVQGANPAQIMAARAAAGTAGTILTGGQGVSGGTFGAKTLLGT